MKKILIINKRTIIFAICIAFFLSMICVYFSLATIATSPNVSFSVIIDAGHGGKDGGAVGKSGVTESYLNLQYAKELERQCKEAGFKVVMTRMDMNGLYSPLAENKKRSEMEKREKIINESDGKIVVSLHMNSFPLSSLSGAQVFYKEGNQSGEALAKSVQNSFKNDLQNARGEASVGDYYVLNCTDKAAILVECGFLSNEEEEKKLCDENYKKEFCSILLRGILNFYSV